MKIKVEITRRENAILFGCAVGDTVEVEFESYVAAVVASEIGNSSPEACKAQALAARTFAVKKGVLDGKTITDVPSSDQAFRWGRYDRKAYPNAVLGAEETSGEILTWAGKSIDAVYSASNGGRTVSSAERWGGSRPYLTAWDDPWDTSATRTGHGVGMSQRGAKWAADNGYGYRQILEHYYPGCEIHSINSEVREDEEKGGDKMVTARAFIEKILIPLAEAWGYIYGYAGVKWTAALQDKVEQTTDSNRQASRQYGSQWIGRMVTDCSGLLRWALRQLGLDIVHHARYQYTNACTNKGTLVGGQRSDGKPILPGTAVFLKGKKPHIHHVGVYVGGGICVEAKGARYGVVTSGLDHWDYWGELTMVDYTDAAALEGALEIPQRGDSAGGDTPVSGMRAVVNNPRNYLNLRAKPDSSSARLAQMPRGAVVEVIEGPGTHDEWWQVKFAGRIGWAWAEYLQLIEDNVDEPGDTEQEISAEPEAAPPEASGVSPADSAPAQPSAQPITQADLDALLVLIETAQLAMDKLDTRLETMKHSVEAMTSREAGE